MSKKQIWLRPDQVDLMRCCLELAQTKLNEGYVDSKVHKMAGRYTFRRITELIALLDEKKEPV